MSSSYFLPENRRGKGFRSKNSGKFKVESLASIKKIVSPQNIALLKLRNELKQIPGFRTENINFAVDRVSKAEQLRFMNMVVLSRVLHFFSNYGYDLDNVTPNNINIYIDILIGLLVKNKPSEEELKIITLKFNATFYRYAKYVISLNTN